ncbi:Phage portal protein, SPP1 Gp6 [Desulfitobacterium hafniense]|uniref:Phage portal protein, SPP1 Gp6 n=1 Tax=Desulfitobacterium hafniense TaxID=49338 RepID=A0A098B634_DESHA|nr:phage portal protein [Desulfitobacterium hafniense]CDX03331.1 Phage portal protein, SPP1 Gp6 [Desulfitobacterium hafniense]
MNLQQYINTFHDGKEDWFIEETNNFYNQQKVMNIINIKEYLSGKHAILNRQVEVWNGKEYYPRTIVLNYAKTILNFSTSYLLKNPVTISGDEASVKAIKDIYKKGNYNKIDYDILDKVCKYGYVAEYVFVDADGKIKSKLINPEDSYPIYNEQGEMIGFIEHYTTDFNVSYYNIFTNSTVQKWSNAGGDLNFLGEYNNPSGLPVVYKNLNEMDNTDGRSDLEDFVNIIDNMEDLLSKYTDSIYKFVNPIPVVVGQKLGIGKNGEGAIPSNLVGSGLQLDDGGSFGFANGQLDYKSFESVWKVLYNSLLNVSSVPAVSMGVQDVSNLSEVSIKLLFSLADLRAGLNEKYMREGMMQRFKVFEKLLGIKGITIDVNEVELVFQYARPMNEKDIIDNLKTLKEMGAISLQSALEQNPYVYDVASELEKIREDNSDRNIIKTNEDE